MDLKVSRPVQILALVLVIAGVGGIASLQLLGKSSAGPGQELSVAQIRARARAQRPAPAAAPTPKPAAAKPKPVATPKPQPVAAANGLPTLLNDALRANRVVVVSVFDPQVKADAFSYSEAKAGAADAGVGFVAVSVLDDSLTGPLTTKIGSLLPVPGLLIYRGSNGDLIERIDGFADRDAVAQLAIEARTAEPIAAAPATP